MQGVHTVSKAFKKQTVVVKSPSWFGLAIYLAIGAGLYLLFWGEPDWHRTFTYVFILLWPFILIGMFWAVILAGCGLFLLGGYIWYKWEDWGYTLQARRRRIKLNRNRLAGK
jgi:hypothetical protein